MDNWLSYLSTFKGEHLTKWLEYAYKLQLIHRIEEDQLLNILKEGDSIQTKKRLQIIINGNRLDIIDNNIDYKYIVYNGILNNELSVFQRKSTVHSLNFAPTLFR